MLLFVGVPVLFVMVFVVAIIASPSRGGGGGSWEPSTSSDDTDTTPMDPNTLTAPVASSGGIGAPVAVDPSVLGKQPDNGWAGYCHDDQPMDADDPEVREYYDLEPIGVGSAKRLRGKVALVHLLLSSASMKWTAGEARDAERSALLAARFMDAEAKRYGVTDLEITPTAWALRSTLEIDLTTDEQNRVTRRAAQTLIRTSLEAAETSLGSTMEEVVASLNRDGFDEVAFLLHFPVHSDAREFAYPVPNGLSDIDVAVLYAEDLTDLGSVTAHETMHLFGADDLYPLSRLDPADATDIMRGDCNGLGAQSIQAMTAYTIGWRKKPRRVYPSR